MNSYGLLTTSIVFSNNKRNYNILLSSLETFNQSKDGIYLNPFDYEKRIKLDEIREIDIFENNVYCIEYRIQKNNLFVFLNKNSIIIEHSRYLDTSMPVPLKEIIYNHITSSELTLVGFETNLFTDEYPKNIESILNDKSLYPLYLYRKESKQAGVNFNKYSLINSNNNMEFEIEAYILDIFKENDAKIEYLKKKIFTSK